MSEQTLGRPRSRRASDRVTVALFSLAAFLLVLALLGTQLSQAGSSHAARADASWSAGSTRPPSSNGFCRRGSARAGGSSVTQSVSGSSSGSLYRRPSHARHE